MSYAEDLKAMKRAIAYPDLGWVTYGGIDKAFQVTNERFLKMAERGNAPRPLTADEVEALREWLLP